ncbi:MAG: hypothetical protein QOF66_5176 [Mycobacterium sp.]|jgi:hypothetical protein|nr:hypothetical protein [Mycobacterium sp.]
MARFDAAVWTPLASRVRAVFVGTAILLPVNRFCCLSIAVPRGAPREVMDDAVSLVGSRGMEVSTSGRTSRDPLMPDEPSLTPLHSGHHVRFFSRCQHGVDGSACGNEEMTK